MAKISTRKQYKTIIIQKNIENNETTLQSFIEVIFNYCGIFYHVTYKG